MAFQIPRPLHVEHENCMRNWSKQPRWRGRLAKLRTVAALLHPHFVRGSVCPATAECVIPFSRGEGHTGDAGCPPNDRQIADRAAADAC